MIPKSNGVILGFDKHWTKFMMIKITSKIFI